MYEIMCVCVCVCVYMCIPTSLKFWTRELSQLSAYRTHIAGNSCAVHRKRLACRSAIQRASVTKLGRVRESRRKSGKIACTQNSSGGSGPRTATLAFVPYFKVANDANVISENCLTSAGRIINHFSSRLGPLINSPLTGLLLAMISIFNQKKKKEKLNTRF